MNYQEAVAFLYERLPMFQRTGAAALKPGLGNISAFLEKLQNPHLDYPTIHIAGTNGKGTVAHLLASVLQEVGYKVGLFTSPHFVSFTERIKVNGVSVEESRVVQFVESNKPENLPISPSFFEYTTAMAFQTFKEVKVDIAIIETGLGGRLDSTNVINPLLSIITSIGLDHEHLLGNTLTAIAKEKAGIIKPLKPVVVGALKEEALAAITAIAKQQKSLLKAYSGKSESTFDWNVWMVKQSIEILNDGNYSISDKHIEEGILNVVQNTQYFGRFQQQDFKGIKWVYDVGHNAEAVSHLMNRIHEELNFEQLYVVWGMSNDKESQSVLKSLPSNAYYLFTKADVPRAKNEEDLWQEAQAFHLKGEKINSVYEALKKVGKLASSNDLVLIGGSFFVVAEALQENFFKK